MKFLKSLNQPKTFEARPLTAFIFNLIFSRKTWITLFVLISLSSLYLNYYFIRSNYVLNCGVNGEVVARLITQAKCNELAETKMDALEMYRLKEVQAMSNQDIY
jgi:hypothetical protein